MKSIFDVPRLRAQQSRNAFDRSSKRVFSAPYGMILPCFVARVSPNDFIELSPENQIICEPLVKPAFMRLKEHFDYFFVPFSQLYTPFENMVTAQDNFWSSAISSVAENKVPNQVPLFDADFLAAQLNYMSRTADVHNYNNIYGSLRLLDLLGYGNYYGRVSQLSSSPSDACVNNEHIPNMNFFNLLAYQKIYYDYFRNTKYERNVTSAFNIDFLPPNDILTPLRAGEDWRSVFEVHYRWLKKDYFMSVQPNVLPDSSQIGYSGLDNIYSSKSVNFQVPGIGTPASSPLQGDPVGINYGSVSEFGIPQNASNNFVPAGSAQMSASSIRLTFALDRLLRRQREAGAQFDKQMLAQFGVVPYDERHGKCVFIGGQTNRLYSSDITNTSETGDEGLGSLGGQINVYSASRRTLKYHAKEHGIVMGIYSTSLDSDYPSFYISRDNVACGRFDWFNPQMDRLGLQPLFRHELNILSDHNESYIEYPDTDPTDFATKSENREILGYVRRYMEYKTNYDTVHGLFASKNLSASDAAWVAKYRMQNYGNNQIKQQSPLAEPTMVENPMTFDDVSNVNYNGQWNTDHFKINHFTHCKVISDMDTVGEDF